MWYLMAVLVLEIWLDYRRDIVVLSQTTTGWKRLFYKAHPGFVQHQRPLAGN